MKCHDATDKRQVRRSRWRDSIIAGMPTRESAIQRGDRRGRSLLRRAGEDLRRARLAAGASTRRVGWLVGISHTQVRRIEGGVAPHVDLGVLSRMATVLGHDLSLGIHPAGAPVRDSAHVALLDRFRRRIEPSIRWRTEVPMPQPGDLRSADATLDSPEIDAMVEAETRLDDVQATERRARTKQRDLGRARLILVVADTRHNRAVLRSVPELSVHFPVGTRACLAALSRGRDPGGDCLVLI